MVTKTLRVSKTSIGTTKTEVGKITCPEGYTRRIVEVRNYYSSPGIIYTKRDTEEIDEWDYDQWNHYKLPQYLDIMLGPRNEYVIEAAADSGTIDVSVEVKVEETKG
ncbi:MAG: hypothetical protein JRD89_04930 [Deltaproteobacteria bacterium]|nr:hypothetical protein [Deltaproteobacteria bacterium]